MQNHQGKNNAHNILPLPMDDPIISDTKSSTPNLKNSNGSITLKAQNKASMHMHSPTVIHKIKIWNHDKVKKRLIFVKTSISFRCLLSQFYNFRIKAHINSRNWNSRTNSNLGHEFFNLFNHLCKNQKNDNVQSLRFSEILHITIKSNI